MPYPVNTPPAIGAYPAETPDDLIYTVLAKTDYTGYPPGLKDGQMAFCLFFSLYSELKGNAKAREKALELFSRIDFRTAIARLRVTLLTGRLGLGWGLLTLAGWEVLDKDDALEELLDTVDRTGIYYFQTLPTQLCRHDDLFSIGIYQLKRREAGDSLARYCADEKLIGLIDECERLLNVPVTGIHRPTGSFTKPWREPEKKPSLPAGAFQPYAGFWRKPVFTV